MDEPYGAVDPINLEVIKGIIVNLQKRGVSIRGFQLPHPNWSPLNVFPPVGIFPVGGNI